MPDCILKFIPLSFSPYEVFMSIREGFASRSCFCLWSTDTDIVRTIEDNHKTYLHVLWELDHFYEGSPDVKGVRSFSVCPALWSSMSYPVGMIGYLLDTVIKLILLIGNFLMLLVSTLSCNSEWRDKRCLIFLDTLAAIGISAIGTLMPPLAYKLDQMACTAIIEWSQNLPATI